MKMPYLFIIFMLFTSCEKEVEYVQIPQREIPILYLTEKENVMGGLLNNYRDSKDLPPLKTSLDLYHLAKAKAYLMNETNSLNHNGFYDRYLNSGALFFGECVSQNFHNPIDNINAFISSPPHRAIFDSPIYEYYAIADVNNWCCILFARYRPFNGKMILEVKEIKIGNISKIEILK